MPLMTSAGAQRAKIFTSSRLSRLFPCLLLCLTLACSGQAPDAPKAARPLSGLSELPLDAVKSSGARLMEAPLGLSWLAGAGDAPGEAAILVHGFASRGYEWVEAAHAPLAPNRAFYRWRWLQCPASAAQALQKSLEALAQQSPKRSRLILLGHSYGGRILAEAAQRYQGSVPLDVHLIAAPLQPLPRLSARCPDDKLPTSGLRAPHRWRQWRTKHALDGAFKGYAEDPQVRPLPALAVEALPETFRGHRLGHNWSVSAVVERLVQPNATP